MDRNMKISAGMAIVFSVAAGLAVGNLYWAQPLLSAIAEDFGTSPSQGGYLVTATQLGYALGILLIVPLGDILERRKLLSAVMVLTVGALMMCSLAPSFAVLFIALGALGLVTVSGQIILPLVGDLATDETRGRMVGIVSSGITSGILFSRLLSGLVADLWDWRSIYLMAAALNLVMVAVIRLHLPKVPTQGKIPYKKLISDVFTAVKRYPEMRGIMLKQGMIFGITFNLFWTALTFLLSDAPFHYSTFQIGLVSLAGLTGAISGTRLGTLQDRGLGQKGTAVFIGMSIASMGLAALFGTSIFAILLVAAVFSLAVQGVGILCQSQIFALSDTERSRLNTVFVVSNFLFCAGGSSLATLLWNIGGWSAAMAGAVAASLVALSVHFYAKKTLGIALAVSLIGFMGCGFGGESVAERNVTNASSTSNYHEFDAKQVGRFDMEHDCVRLNSGYDMPLVGIGTWAISDSEAEESVYSALTSGMRLIDTAVVYGNESGVGRGIKRAGVPREEIFLTTKLWMPDYENADQAIDRCLSKLGTDYIDLLLLHYAGEHDEDAYRAMERAVKSGKVRSIGLSNFYKEDFERIVKMAEILPAVDQLETHLHHQNEDMGGFLKAYGTVLESWFPFGGRGQTEMMFQEPVVQKLADVHRKSPAQIILRWHLQAGHVVIPGSTNPAHIKENYEVFDFVLTEEEMQELSKLERNALYGGYY